MQLCKTCVNPQKCEAFGKCSLACALGFDEDHSTGNDRSGRSIKHSYTGEGKNTVD